MPPTVPNWKVWPAETRFMLHIFVHELTGLPQDGLRRSPSGELAVKVEWRGNRQKAETVLRGPRRSLTSRRPARPDGVVSWEEGLSHVCKLKMQSYQIYKSWIINLEIHGYGFRPIISPALVGKARIDAAPYARLKGKSLMIPIGCDVNGFVATGGLMVTMEFMEVQRKEKPRWPLLRVLTLSFKHRSSKESTESDGTTGTLFSSHPTTEASSDESPATQTNTSREHTPEQAHHRRHFSSLSFRKPQLLRGLSWSKWRSSTFKELDPEVLNGANREGRGVERTNSLRVLMEKEPPMEVGTAVEDAEEVFDVGTWEKRRVVSRDGKMEMITDVFFASIDQCSEKAAGEGACAVLVTVIADWLHRNKRTLPLRQVLDEMIRTGSSEWRALCRESTHRRRFSDRHFDLDTVLAAELRPLALVNALSYIGFFMFDETPEGLEYLNEAMSFDSIFDELVRTNADEERIYIASWNDHFFVLKVATDAIYLIDTLGERLYEGCNQAYVVKFGDDSVIQTIPDGEPKSEDGGSGRVVVCKGMGTCREYMKEFLAAVPLREMRSEIERGAVSHADVHRRLQIEFHYTVPL